MPIAVICPGCKTSFRVNEKFAGKQGPCPKCKGMITIPKTAAVEIEAPEEFVSGGKSVTGQPSFRPIVHVDKRFNWTIALVIGFVAILIVIGAAVLGRSSLNMFAAQPDSKGYDGYGNDELAIAVSLLLISPLYAWAAYQALRDPETEAHRGIVLIVRATICGVCYAGLWAGYRAVPDAFTEELWSWIFIIPPMLLVGALVALGCFDFQFGPAFVHYALYVAICMGLAWIGGRDILPEMISGGAPQAMVICDGVRGAVGVM